MNTVLMLCLVLSAGQKEEAVKVPVLEKTTSQKKVAVKPQKKKESQKNDLKEAAPEAETLEEAPAAEEGGDE